MSFEILVGDCRDMLATLPERSVQGRQWLHQLVRWTSNRPDPRHVQAITAEAA